MKLRIAILVVLFLAARMFAASSAPRIVLSTNVAPTGLVEVRGVEAGAFDPGMWKAGKLNFVPDMRSPLLAPLLGRFRNIYAPSVVETPDGYRVFYGAWDGLASGNDHIYSATTDRDFQEFTDRHMVLSPGTFTHVCNVNALRLEDSAYAMFATVYPVDGQNRPGFFKSDRTGTNWNGMKGEPYTVLSRDLANITGYDYSHADINGLNVMLREASRYRLYFGDMHHLPGVFRASSEDGAEYQFEKKVYSANGLVNDVKKFHVGQTSFYLMGLHENGSRLWQTLSTDPLVFPPAQPLLTNAVAADRYIVALGWVTRGAQELPGRKVIGVFYGAGPVVSLDHNQIYARWLQKRVVFVADSGTRYASNQALGPDRQFLQIPVRDLPRGHFEIYSEDGETLLGASPEQDIRPGQTYQLLQP